MSGMDRFAESLGLFACVMGILLDKWEAYAAGLLLFLVVWRNTEKQ